MDNSCTVEFFEGSSYPIHIAIIIDPKTFFINITKLDNSKLENFLTDKHIIDVKFDTEQKCVVVFERFSDTADIRVKANTPGGHCVYVIYVDNNLVCDLANKIHEYVDGIPKPVIDLLAGAKKRTDDNLNSIFG